MPSTQLRPKVVAIRGRLLVAVILTFAVCYCVQEASAQPKGQATPAGSSAPVAAADARAGLLIYTGAVGEARRVNTGPDWAAAGLEAGDQILRYRPVMGSATTLAVLRGSDRFVFCLGDDVHARQCSCGATELMVLRCSDRLVFKAKALKALRGESALRTEVLSFLNMIPVRAPARAALP